MAISKWKKNAFSPNSHIPKALTVPTLFKCPQIKSSSDTHGKLLTMKLIHLLWGLILWEGVRKKMSLLYREPKQNFDSTTKSNLRNPYTYWVYFTEQGWGLAHKNKGDPKQLKHQKDSPQQGWHFYYICIDGLSHSIVNLSPSVCSRLSLDDAHASNAELYIVG